jgi:ABC-type multidrug transport system fused ATPase/permease subunit
MSALKSEASKEGLAPAPKTLLRCMSYLRPYWKYVAGSYILLMMTNGITLAMPLIIQYIIDTGIRNTDITSIWQGSAVLMLITLVRGVFTSLLQLSRSL